jgi:hypothetical protein
MYMTRVADNVTDHSVGLLYTVYSHTRVPGQRVVRFLEEAQESSTTARRQNPLLPTALATNLVGGRSNFAAAFTLIQTVHVGGGGKWLPRLRALAHSPFELTLAVDDTVMVCSSLLHQMLLREHASARFDFAVNFETSSFGTRGSANYGPRPSAPAQILPHNFAQLARKVRGRVTYTVPLTPLLHTPWHTPCDARPVRDAMRVQSRLSVPVHSQGPGLRLLLSAWAARLGGGTDDQYGLRETLKALQPGMSRGAPRVWRLRENIGGFKSVDKVRGPHGQKVRMRGPPLAPRWRMPGAFGFMGCLYQGACVSASLRLLAPLLIAVHPQLMVGPRYSRPVTGDVLAWHGFPASERPARSFDCALLNRDVDATRLLFQRDPAAEYASATTRGACLREMRNTSTSGGRGRHAHRFSPGLAERVCSMLPAAPQRAPRAPSSLAEPMGVFWSWLCEQNLTAGACSGHARRAQHVATTIAPRRAQHQQSGPRRRAWQGRLKAWQGTRGVGVEV